MENNSIKKVLLNWDLIPKTIAPIRSSIWEIDGCYVLKKRDNCLEMQNNILLSKLLHKEGLPVTEYKEDINGKYFVSDDNGCYCLMRKLKGVHLNVFQSEKELPFQLGEVLARLHQALKKIEKQAQCQHKDLREEWSCYIVPEIEQKNIDIPPEIRNNVQNWLVNVYPILPRQLIHRDPHMGNFLFDEGKLTGYIDFDLSVNNARIFDLCYFALSILSDGIHDIEKSERRKEIFSDMVNGYEKTLPLCDLEHQSFGMIMVYIELLFVAFWSGKGNAVQMEESLAMAIWLMEHMY